MKRAKHSQRLFKELLRRRPPDVDLLNGNQVVVTYANDRLHIACWCKLTGVQAWENSVVLLRAWPRKPRVSTLAKFVLHWLDNKQKKKRDLELKPIAPQRRHKQLSWKEIEDDHA